MQSLFRPQRCRAFLAFVALGISFHTAGVARAADWQFVPSVSLTQTYTDNVFLTDGNEQGDFITSVIPSISVRGTGRRLNINADYNHERRKFLDNGELDNGTNNLQGNVTTELVRDHLFVNGFASMFPSLVSNNGLINNRNRSRQDRVDQLDTSNRANVVTYGISPRWVQRFGSFATFEARTAFSDISTGTGANGVGGGANQEWSAALNSDRRFGRSSWGVSYTSRTNETELENQTAEFSNLTGTFGYQVNRIFRATSTVGYEDNSFQANAENQQSGLTWTLGGVLTPTPRTRLAGNFGNRVFGSTKSFSFTHTHRRIAINGSYTEDLNTTSDLLRQQQVFARTDAFGNPIPVNPTQNVDFRQPLDALSLTDDVFISRQLDTSIGYIRRRDQFSMAVFRTEQESTRSAVTESTFGMSGTWRRTLSRLLSAGVVADYNVRESDNRAGTTTFVSFSPFVSYAIGPQLNSRLSYSYLNSDSELGEDSFTENSVLGSLTYAF